MTKNVAFNKTVNVPIQTTQHKRSKLSKTNQDLSSVEHSYVDATRSQMHFDADNKVPERG
jgi:hypothetical protein